jgi:hypothetical protein
MDLYKKFIPDFNDVNIKLPKVTSLPVEMISNPNIEVLKLKPLPVEMISNPNIEVLKLKPLPVEMISNPNIEVLKLKPLPVEMISNLNLKMFTPPIPRFDVSIPPLSPLPKPKVAKPQNNRDRRLQFEKAIVRKEMPQFTLCQEGNSASFEGVQETRIGGVSFYLKVSIPPHYPDQMPNLYIISPLILPKSGGGTINESGSTHSSHTSVNGPGGCVQICHFESNSWDATKTCAAVLIKGILWLEAYAMSLLTDMNIAEIIDQWDRGQQ